MKSQTLHLLRGGKEAVSKAPSAQMQQKINPKLTTTTTSSSVKSQTLHLLRGGREAVSKGN